MNAFRSAASVCFLGLALFAGAAPKVCRLSEDHALLVDGNERFPLARDAGVAWDLADKSQEKKFKSWRSKNSMVGDPGQIIEGLTKQGKTLAKAAEAEIVPSGSDLINVSFKVGEAAAEEVRLEGGADSWSLAKVDAPVFAKVAKSLALDRSTLAVLLADARGDIGQDEALSKFVTRARKSDLYLMLPKHAGVVWVHTAKPAASAPTDSTETKKPEKVADKTAQEDSGGWIPWAIGCVVIAAGGGGWMAWSRFGGAARAPAAPKTVRKELLEDIEFGLLQDLREEARKRQTAGGQANRALREVIEEIRFQHRNFDGLSREKSRLESYREFRNSFDAFQSKLDQANATVETQRAQLLQAESEVARLSAELNTSSSALRSSQEETDQAEQILRELQAWSQAIAARLAALEKP